MKVKLLTHTPQPVEIIYRSARTCYSPQGPITLSAKERDSMITLINRVIEAGHHSVLEHVSFTFAIEGVSRALTHQLVRHRLASYSQQSQRYVDYTKHSDSMPLDFVTPKTVSSSKEASDIYTKTIADINEAYTRLVQLGVPPEDARYLLPNATGTKLVMTMNFRELLTVSSLRLCYKAQWEIVQLFAKIKNAVKEADPFLAGLLQPKCQHAGFCSEAEPCGKYTFKKT